MGGAIKVCGKHGQVHLLIQTVQTTPTPTLTMLMMLMMVRSDAPQRSEPRAGLSPGSDERWLVGSSSGRASKLTSRRVEHSFRRCHLWLGSRSSRLQSKWPAWARLLPI